MPARHRRGCSPRRRSTHRTRWRRWIGRVSIVVVIVDATGRGQGTQIVDGKCSRCRRTVGASTCGTPFTDRVHGRGCGCRRTKGARKDVLLIVTGVRRQNGQVSEGFEASKAGASSLSLCGSPRERGIDSRKKCRCPQSGKGNALSLSWLSIQMFSVFYYRGKRTYGVSKLMRKAYRKPGVKFKEGKEVYLLQKISARLKRAKIGKKCPAHHPQYTNNERVLWQGKISPGLLHLGGPWVRTS